MRISDVLFVLVLVFALLTLVVSLPAYAVVIGLVLLSIAGLLVNRGL